MFAWGNFFAALVLFTYHYRQGSDWVLLMVFALDALVMLVVLVQSYGRREWWVGHLRMYNFAIWYGLVFGIAWSYVLDHFSRFHLLLLLISTSTYYLMTEWRYTVSTLVSAALLCVLLMLVLGRPIVMPPIDHAVLIVMASVVWMGYSLSNRSQREQRLRDAQSMVRHAQRGLQPGLQSVEGLLYQFDAAAQLVANAASAQRIRSIAQHLKVNTQGMQEYLDLQSINARFLSLNDRVQTLTAGALVQKAVDDYPYASEALRRAVSVEVEQDFHFVGDRQQWEVLWRNLLDNALAAVQAHTDKPLSGDVRISIRWAGGTGRMAIRDFGAGIAHADLPYLFEPFYAAGRTAGLGLGLSYCRTVVEQCGGHIQIESDAQRGTCASILLHRSERA